MCSRRELWAEVFQAANYHKIRTPSQLLGGKAPLEVKEDNKILCGAFVSFQARRTSVQALKKLAARYIFSLSREPCSA